MAELEWAVIGYDKNDDCEFIDRQPEDRADAEFSLRTFYSNPALYRDVRVVCRIVGEWTADAPDTGQLDPEREQ